MREIALHGHAANYLKRMPADRKEQVITALQSLRPLTGPEIISMLKL